jgi:hypothetical protein
VSLESGALWQLQNSVTLSPWLMIRVSIVGCVHLYGGNWMGRLAVPEQRHARQERFTATPKTSATGRSRISGTGRTLPHWWASLGVRRRGCLLQPIVHMTAVREL